MKRILVSVLLLCMLFGGLGMIRTISEESNGHINLVDGPNWPPDDGNTSQSIYL